MRRPSLALHFAVVAAVTAACATPVRIVQPKGDLEVPLERVAADLATADVVVFGERHDDASVHETHQDLLRQLHARRPDVIVAMEMFERDVQPVLWQYLLGDIDESEFLAKARPWPNYDNDYRPVVEFARARKLEVLAANAPRALCSKVAKEGIAALPASPHVAKSTTAPDDDYSAAFRDEMQKHPGVKSESIERYYQAQCLKDDTMAETIVDRLAQVHSEGRKPVVVLFCGHMHSDHRRGVVRRIQQRAPSLRIVTLGVETVPEAENGTIASAPTVADYVLLVPEREAAPAVAMPTADAKPEAKSPEAGKPEAVKPEAVKPTPSAPPSTAQPEGGRPGLGIRPEYDADAEGCVVGDVVPDGAADAAGILPGDVIVALGDQEVTSVATYAVALGNLAIGQKVEVTLKRGTQTVKLPVVVGRSNR